MVFRNVSTPAITPAPTPTTTGLQVFTSGSPLACYNTDFVGALLGAYQGLSTDPALQCECLTQLSNWLVTTAPGTHTITRSIGTGATGITEVISGRTTTETTELVNVATYTVTENGVGADGNFWYGSATSPCVSLIIALKEAMTAKTDRLLVLFMHSGRRNSRTVLLADSYVASNIPRFVELTDIAAPSNLVTSFVSNGYT